MAITDDAEMMTYGCDRNTLTHTYLRTLCFMTDLLVNKLATEEVSNNTARDSGSQGKFCPARDGDRLALRMQVSLGWKSREDLLPTSLSVTEKGDGQEYSATYFTGQGSKRPRSLRFTQPLGEMPAR